MNYIRHVKNMIHQKYVEEICPYGNELYTYMSEKTQSVSKYIDKEKFVLGCFIKSEESISRKILSKLKANDKDYLDDETYDNVDYAFQEEMKTVRDFFRMNFELDVDNFEDELKEIIKAVLEKNDKLKPTERFDNTFKKETMGYKDLKICFKYKEYYFEMQFHTRESNELNKKTHGIYEVFRSMEPCDDRESLKMDRNQLFKDLAIPTINEQEVKDLIGRYNDGEE